MSIRSHVLFGAFSCPEYYISGTIYIISGFLTSDSGKPALSSGKIRQNAF